MMLKAMLIISLTVSGLTAYSQTYIGVKMGMTNAWQSADSRPNSLKQGLTYGLSGAKELCEKMSLKVDLVIAERGYKQRFDNDDLFDQFTMTYFDVPLVLNYKIMELDKSKSIHVEFGGYYGRWLSGKYKSRIKPETSVVDEDYVFTSIATQGGFVDNRNEWGVVAGVGVQLPVKSNVVNLDFRYTYGLNSIYKLAPGSFGNDVHNRSIAFSITYGFTLGK